MAFTVPSIHSEVAILDFVPVLTRRSGKGGALPQ